jgi:anti-sigma-K factor RskA
MAVHDQLADQAALYALGALTGPEAEAFEAHLATCAICAAEVRAFTPVTTALGRLPGPVDPPAGARDRLIRRVKGSPRFQPSWMVAAASIALAVALGAYAGQLRGRIGTLESRLREAMLRADASERQVADVRRTAFEAQSAVAVLTAPDVARIELAGQPVAPRASARAFWSRSRGMVFTASNLPPLPAGRTYQVWVVTAQPAPTSVGLLKPDANGRADARFETPPDIPQPVALAVTIEPEGGVPAPTGEKYLIGLAH